MLGSNTGRLLPRCGTRMSCLVNSTPLGNNILYIPQIATPWMDDTDTNKGGHHRLHKLYALQSWADIQRKPTAADTARLRGVLPPKLRFLSRATTAVVLGAIPTQRCLSMAIQHVEIEDLFWRLGAGDLLTIVFHAYECLSSSRSADQQCHLLVNMGELKPTLMDGLHLVWKSWS